MTGRAILQCVGRAEGGKVGSGSCRAPCAKLKSLYLILESVVSHSGIFSGFAIQKSQAEQEGGLQGV